MCPFIVKVSSFDPLSQDWKSPLNLVYRSLSHLTTFKQKFFDLIHHPMCILENNHNYFTGTWVIGLVSIYFQNNCNDLAILGTTLIQQGKKSLAT